MDSATELLLLKERLISQAPFASERIGLAQTGEELLDIAIELLDSRAETQLRLEFGLGAKVDRGIRRVDSGKNSKVAKGQAINQKVAEHYLWSYQDWLKYPDIGDSEAKRKARHAACKKYEKLTSRSIAWKNLQTRLRPHLKQ